MPNEIEHLDKILGNVSKFYGDAWASLVTVVATIIGASIAIVGVIIPLVIAYFQRKQQSGEFESMIRQNDSEIHSKLEDLKKIIADENDKLKRALEEKVEQVFAEKEKIFLDKIQNVRFSNDASIFHIQGLIFSFNKDPLEANFNYVKAALFYLKCKDEYNLSLVCSNISHIAEAIKTQDLKSAKGKQFTDDLRKLIKELRNKENGGSIRRIGDDLENTYSFIQ